MLLPSLLLATAATAVATPMTVSFVPDSGGAFALTFDGDQEAHGTAELLALLRRRGVHATLFVTGRFAELHPLLLKQAAEDGHEIGNHTYSHPHLTTWAENHRHDTRPDVTRAVLQHELRRAAAAIEKAIGRPPAPLWRAPFGEHNGAIRAWAAELGLVHVDWTRGCGDALDALDWVEDPSSRRYMGPEAMARRLFHLESQCGVPLDGSIVLMHLGSSRPDPPLLEAIPIFLDETDRRDLEPVPVSELLRRGGVKLPGSAPSAPPPPR